MIVLGEICCITVTHYVIRYHDQIADMFEAELVASQQGSKGSDINRSDETNGNSDAVVKTESSATAASQDQPCALLKTTFRQSQDEGSVVLHIRRPVQYGYIVCCITAVIFVLLGCTLSSFYFNVSGIIGSVFNLNETTDPYSAENNIFTIARNLITSAKIIGDGRAYIGLGSLAILVIATVLFAPIILVLVQLVRWVYPLADTTQIRLRNFSQMLELWNFCDVYFFAVIICSQQSVQLSKFVASTYCITFSNILKSLAYWGILDETADECIVIESKVHPAVFFFLLVAILLACLRRFLECVLKQRQNEGMKKSTVSEELKTLDRAALQKYLDNLKPPPVQFIDRFRWALHSESKHMHT